MKDILRPILELLVVLPGLLLGYFPVKTYLKQSPGRLAVWLFPLMACRCIGSGLACYRLHASTVFALAGVALAAICLYTRTLTISLWKSGTIALSVCAVFACVNSLSRAVSAAIIRNLQLPPDGPWLCLGACVFYNAVCWIIVLAAYYPATHTVRAMVEDDNFAQTWYVFWVLPLAFILLNLFMIPRYQSTLQTGRVLQGYIVLSSALLVFMFCFNAIFLLMATSLNRNAKLQQENQFLSMHGGEDFLTLGTHAHADFLAQAFQFNGHRAEAFIGGRIVDNHHHIEEAVDDGLRNVEHVHLVI